MPTFACKTGRHLLPFESEAPAKSRAGQFLPITIYARGAIDGLNADDEL